MVATVQTTLSGAKPLVALQNAKRAFFGSWSLAKTPQCNAGILKLTVCSGGIPPFCRSSVLAHALTKLCHPPALEHGFDVSSLRSKPPIRVGLRYVYADPDAVVVAPATVHHGSNTPQLRAGFIGLTRKRKVATAANAILKAPPQEIACIRHASIQG